MPTNKLRSQAARLLARALEAQRNGRMAEARELTMKAAQCLEDAMSVEQIRSASPRVAVRTRVAARSVSAQSQR